MRPEIDLQGMSIEDLDGMLDEALLGEASALVWLIVGEIERRDGRREMEI